MSKPHLLAALGAALLATGHLWGLLYSPGEAWMGPTVRIMYVHVPAAAAALLCTSLAALSACAALWTGSQGADRWRAALTEVALVLTALMLVQGSIWARPTWGAWYTPDPRTLASTVLLVGLAVVRGVDALAGERRLNLGGALSIVVAVMVPLTVLANRIPTGIHPLPSGPGDLAPGMAGPLVLGLVGMTALALGMAWLRRGEG